MVQENSELAKVCSEIALEIDIAKQAWEVWSCIGDHAEANNVADRPKVGPSSASRNVLPGTKQCSQSAERSTIMRMP